MNTLVPLALALPALLMAGAAAGFAGGLFGIGGGFVVVPALMFLLPMLGVAPDHIAHVAVGTSLATIIFTSIRSTSSHARRGSVDFDLLKGWAVWVVLGTAIGTVFADLVSGALLAVIFGTGVLAFAVYFLLPARQGEPLFAALPSGLPRVGIASALGAFSTLLGIGGGTLTTLTMTVCGTPIHRAIGTAAGMGAVIAIPATIGFVLIGLGESGLGWGALGYVHLPAAVVLIATSVAFAPLGVAAAHMLSPAILRRVFGLYLTFIGVLMIAKF
ncbi:sulfite exporter TauE/SafE family protein [Erythrobacter sp. sf7]|uniref:Probable membrane transporter protein n=1 Tax=Erythrobacter fulvus TaxID=2987523 RepID=A0ABT5JMW2_9SPHN|nr:sulfite exporter TauE/SafE family protein [Erythrobacter fulvus]MDC8753948.1 sulfite exporter TauE/SafE family protein [Erythrobacter fulvus]